MVTHRKNLGTEDMSATQDGSPIFVCLFKWMCGVFHLEQDLRVILRGEVFAGDL